MYDVKTKWDDIPYELETPVYTHQTIAQQKRRLIKDALNYGLKLKSVDEVPDALNNSVDARTKRVNATLDQRAKS